MKEVGIRAAYGSLADVLTSEADVNDPRNKTLQILYDFRELMVEKMYHAQELLGAKGDVVNTHNVIGYRNPIAEYVGLSRIPDPDTYDNGNAPPMVPTFFERFYTVDSVCNIIAQALNEPPRKLNYNSVVTFLQYNRPDRFKADPEEFLYSCFDEEGNFTRGAIMWMLYKMGILRPVDDDPKSIDIATLFPPMDELSLSQSRDRVASQMQQEETLMKSGGLEKSMGKEEIEDLMTSADLAISHNCECCVGDNQEKHTKE